MKKKKNYTLQVSPFVVPTDDGKTIKEHFGLASDGSSELSIAHMTAPPGWSEPFQTPEFDEYTFIIKGKKQFIINDETIVLEAGQSNRRRFQSPRSFALRFRLYISNDWHGQ